MKVASLYNPLTIVANHYETLSEVARRMHFNDVGSVAVYEDGRMAGILTERDITRAVADHADPDEATAGDFMSSEPATVTPDSDARDAALVMLGMGIRHLPVVVDNALVGLLSIRDVLEDLVWTIDFGSSAKQR